MDKILKLLMAMLMGMSLTACGSDDGNDEPDYPDSPEYNDARAISDALVGFWTCRDGSFDYNYIVFGTDGTFNAFDSFYNTDLYTGYYSVSGDGSNVFTLSLNWKSYTLSMPTPDTILLDGYINLTRTPGTGGGSGGGSGDSDDDVYIPVEALKITEYRFSDTTYEAEYETMYMCEKGADIYLYKYRNGNKYWKASRNYDRDKGGYRVSSYDYKVMDSQNLHMMVYYYF